MRILGPSSLLSAATSVRDGVTDMVFDLPGAVGDALDLLSRTGDLVDRAGSLLTRAEELLARGETAVTAVEEMLQDGEAMLDRAAGVLADAEQTAAGAAETAAAAADITRDVAGTVQAAGMTATAANGLVHRGDAMLSQLEQFSGRAMPMATRVVDSADGREIDALIGMIDRLPTLLSALEEQVLPTLGKLDDVGPDVRDILDGVHDITSALSGLPGAGFLKRRGERREQEGEGLAHGHGHVDRGPAPR